MYITGRKNEGVKPVPLSLCDKPLPWVDQCLHLGVTLSVTGKMDDDCKIKRAEFIGKSLQVREKFAFAHPCELVEVTDKYCSAFYGSNLYDLRGESARMMYASWRTCQKMVWKLPRETKSYFIPHVLCKDILPP